MRVGQAARAAPYEKGTETASHLRVRMSMAAAARAAPYEKGTETGDTMSSDTP